jgi:hypothetical protein
MQFCLVTSAEKVTVSVLYWYEKLQTRISSTFKHFPHWGKISFCVAGQNFAKPLGLGQSVEPML